MNFKSCYIEGLLVIEPDKFSDERGHFMEAYKTDRYISEGITCNFLQDGLSRSRRNVLRGLHFTRYKPQAQLLTVVTGVVFDVVVDLRTESETYGRYFSVTLDSKSGPNQLFMPEGFAHGFCVLSDWADLHYKMTQTYEPSNEYGLLWSDEYLAIPWPVDNPIVSIRDQKHMSFHKLLEKGVIPLLSK